MVIINPLSYTDSYCYSHWKMFPPGTEYTYFYLEARKQVPVMWYGLTHILHQLKKFFTYAQVCEQKELIDAHMGKYVFNIKGFSKLLTKGHWPILIKAAPEGLIIPGGNVLMTIENTDPEFYWVPSFLEAQLLQVWYPCTVGTISHGIKQTIARYLDETGDPTLLPYKLHDFGLRGATSMVSGAIGGSAHLVSFKGTDTVPALDFIRQFYNDPCAGHSIPAAAHHSITTWTKPFEIEAYKHILQEFPTGPLAIVSDSYDIYKACADHWGTALKDQILNRDGFLVIRPDSGDPVITLAALLPTLAEKFGYTENAKGYKVLNPKIRLIWGDGINETTIEEILSKLKESQWSADNITFGMGGALLQKCDRGTFDFAMKCSAIYRNGRWDDVYKEPITDSGKVSKRGRIGLERKTKTKYVTSDLCAPQQNVVNFLQPVFKDGQILKQYSFDEVRNNSLHS